MVKGRKKRYELVYSNTPLFNRIQYHIEVYVSSPSFENLVRVICKEELEEAKKRIKVNKTRSFYRYTPSKAYIRALKNFHSHQNKNNHEVKRSTGQG